MRLSAFICSVFCYLLVGVVFAVGLILGITGNASDMYDTFHFIESSDSVYDLYTAVVCSILLGIWAGLGIFYIIASALGIPSCKSYKL